MNLVSSSISSTSRALNTLVIAEHNSTEVSPGTLSAITAASKLGGDISLLLLGNSCSGIAEKASKINHVKKVIVVNDAQFEHPVAEVYSHLVQQVAKNYSHILAPSSNHGKSKK
jgi:electron transfer flavoprotein alpha subunit